MTSEASPAPTRRANRASWIVPPAFMAVCWGLALFAMTLDLGLGWLPAVLGLAAGVIAAAVWVRRVSALELESSRTGPERWRSRLVAGALALWHAAVIAGGLSLLNSGQGGLLFFAVGLVAPVGAAWLMPYVGRNRADDLWALGFMGVAAALLPLMFWLCGLFHWSAEPLRASLVALVIFGLPVYGALLLPASWGYDAISGVLIAMVAAGAIIGLSLRFKTVEAAPAGVDLRLAPVGPSPAGTVQAAGDAQSHLPTIFTAAQLRDAAWGRSTWIALEWRRAWDSEAGRSAPLPEDALALRALDLSRGTEAWFFLRLEPRMLTARPPVFSPDGRRLAVFVTRYDQIHTHVYEVGPGKVGELLLERPGEFPSDAAIGWSGGDAVVLATPTQWQRVELRSGRVTAEAPREPQRPSTARLYGCIGKEQQRIVLGPNLPARPVLWAFQSPTAFEKLSLRLDAVAAGSEPGEARAIWLAENSGRIACVYRGGTIVLFDSRALAGDVNVDFSATVRRGPYELNLPVEFTESKEGANFTYLPVGGQAWSNSSLAHGALSFVASSPQLGRAVYFRIQRGNRGMTITRLELPGAVSNDFVSNGWLYAARPAGSEGGHVWWGELGAPPKRVRVPLRGLGRLYWPRTADGRTPTARYLRLMGTLPTQLQQYEIPAAQE